MTLAERIRERVSQSLETPRIASDIKNAMERERARSGSQRIGYVAGGISSSSPFKLFKNAMEMRRYARTIESQQESIVVFSAADVQILPFARLAARRLYRHTGLTDDLRVERDFIPAVVTDVFMAPGWEESERARDDHETARRAGLAIYHIKPRQEANQEVVA